MARLLRFWFCLLIPALRSQGTALADHPALAVWEGLDEIVWNFTAYSGLERTAGSTRKDWRRQTPTATAYAAKGALHRRYLRPTRSRRAGIGSSPG